MAKCSECGYLALRNRETRELDEAETAFRRDGKLIEITRAYASKVWDKGTMLHEQVLSHSIHEELPLCFARNVDLRQGFKEPDPEHDSINTQRVDEATVKGIVVKERECKTFTKWQQGFTPKEHREMIDQERERRWHFIELIVFVIITLIAGIGSAIIGALIARGII
jgi:hypothetical protein